MAGSDLAPIKLRPNKVAWAILPEANWENVQLSDLLPALQIVQLL